MQATASSWFTNESQLSPPAEAADRPTFSDATRQKSSLKNETDYLSRGYITYRCREEGILLTLSADNEYIPSKKTQDVLDLLKKLCSKYEKQYEDRMKVCCEKLKSSKSNASRNFFDVAKELFSQNMKWEHIIVLIAFTGRLAVDYILRDMMEYIECLIGWLSVFLFDRLGDWILTHNGWTGILKHTVPDDHQWPTFVQVGVACAVGFSIYKWLTS